MEYFLGKSLTDIILFLIITSVKKLSVKRDLAPGDILEKFKDLIDGKVVVLTPNLVVTRTSPTPEDISPTETKALAKSLQVAILINNFKIEQLLYKS